MIYSLSIEKPCNQAVSEIARSQPVKVKALLGWDRWQGELWLYFATEEDSLLTYHKDKAGKESWKETWKERSG